MVHGSRICTPSWASVLPPHVESKVLPGSRNAEGSLSRSRSTCRIQAASEQLNLAEHKRGNSNALNAVILCLPSANTCRRLDLQLEAKHRDRQESQVACPLGSASKPGGRHTTITTITTTKTMISNGISNSSWPNASCQLLRDMLARVVMWNAELLPAA